jgi:predicted nucleotidyltransferase
MAEDRDARLVQPLIDMARADERISAVLLYGSRVAGSADEHSDVDIGVVTTEEAYDDVVADGPRLVGALGESLFLEWFSSPSELHAILADGVGIELIIDRAADLTLGLPHRFLFDRDGIAERSDVTRMPNAEAPDRDDVRALIHWFWHDVEHLITALGRGRTWWAYGQLEQLRSYCVRLVRLQGGAPSEDDEPYWKLDEAVGPEALAWLPATIVPAEPEAMRQAAFRLIEQYRVLATTLADAHGLEYPTRLDALLSRRLAGQSAARAARPR